MEWNHLDTEALAMRSIVYLNTDSDDPDDWPVDEEATRAREQVIRSRKLQQLTVTITDRRTEKPMRKEFRSPHFPPLEASQMRAQMELLVQRTIQQQIERQPQ